MQLPRGVQSIIEEKAETVGFPALERAAASMSEAYRQGRGLSLSDEERTTAYLVTRMPATYAAAHGVLREVWERAGKEMETVLDVGSGTGAASLAALEWYPNAKITMIEREELPARAARLWLPNATVVVRDAARMDPLPAHDLVMAAYSLGEPGAPPVSRLWAAARKALALIEPGTPRGFALLRRIRDELLRAGAQMAAPCPAAAECPMTEPDWCHFAARVERSSLHRRLKGGALGYEDEKFSYLVVTRDAATMAQARVVRRPQQGSGFIVLETCTPQGLATVRTTKRDRDAFRDARRVNWGGEWRPG